MLGEHGFRTARAGVNPVGAWSSAGGLRPGRAPSREPAGAKLEGLDSEGSAGHGAVRAEQRIPENSPDPTRNMGTG